MLEIVLESLEDAFFDTLKMVPFLLPTYLLIEWIAHKAGDTFKERLRKFGGLGPLWGALLGLVPQCGFSVVAASFYADRIITPGSLLAVFIATSDEALPILISDSGCGKVILSLLIVKFVFAVAVGFFADFAFRKIWRPAWTADSELQHDHSQMINPHEEGEHPHHAGCDHGHCGHCDNHLCEHCCTHTHCHGGIFATALKHTAQVALLIFAVSALLKFGLDILGEEKVGQYLLRGSVIQPFAASVFGLIPSCASSVFLTDLYIGGVVTFGSVIAGLSTGAGAGILVFCKSVRNKKECVLVLVLLAVVCALLGVILNFAAPALGAI